jgi:uncharacterized FAD-dependent dehydrogenase
MWRAGTVRNSSDGYCSKNNEVQGIVTQNGDTILANKMILATAFCARYFELLDRKNIHRSESFRFRGRAEHPQSLIDSIQYSCYRESFASSAL